MPRIAVALAVGLLAGLVATLWWIDDARTADRQAAARETSPAPQPGDREDTHADAPPSTRAQPGLIVRVLRDKAPQAGARVLAFRQAKDEAINGVRWLPAGAETTSPRGTADFPALAGHYALQARLPDGAIALALADVVIADEPTEVVLEVQRAQTVAGRVLNKATRAPIPGATVVFVPLDADESLTPNRFPAETCVTTQADGLGRFSLNAPTTKNGELVARATGFASEEQRLAESGAGEVLLELEAASVASGVVIDARGPVTGAVVRTMPDEAGPVTTGEDGRFSVSVRAGATSVHALGPTGRQAVQRVNLSAGETKRDLRLELVEGHEVRGVVKASGGAPVAGAEVRVLAEPDGNEVASLVSDASGLFTAVAIPPGRYSLHARTGTGSRGRLVGVEVPAPPLELKLLEAGALDGRVTNTAGEGLANVTVDLSWAKALNEPRIRLRTREDGTFSAPDLLPGELSVKASLGDTASNTEHVLVAPGETGHARLVLVPQGRLPLHVVGGKPKQRFRVLVQPRDSRLFDFSTATRTDEEGRATALVAPGRYRVIAMPEGVPSMRVVFDGATVTVTEGENPDLEVPFEVIQDDAALPSYVRHRELGSGVSFDNVGGGVAVGFLASDSPAAKAGLRSGDLVVSIDGVPVRDSLEAFGALRKPRSTSTTVSLLVRRDGAEQTIVVK